MRVLITGSNGFIGKNLKLRLRERADVQVVCFNRIHGSKHLVELLNGVDFVFHLAGVNRTPDPTEFVNGNFELTCDLCRAVAESVRLTGKSIPIIYTSSIQAGQDSAYGRSKYRAEEVLRSTGREFLFPVHVFRLPNVFGKWCLPNYNSVVATFCHNITHNLPIHINDPDAVLRLVYIDDVLDQFIQLMDGATRTVDSDCFEMIKPEYVKTVGELARQIRAFFNSRSSLVTERVGEGYVRALYSTYLSYLPVKEFAYDIPKYEDSRGVFVEMLKTQDSGQFSFFTAISGVTRGGHYHNSKTEKFLVIKGKALFRFRHMLSAKDHELRVSGDNLQIVDTVPGWTHDVTNIGQEELIVMIWANEIFDRTATDTYDSPLLPYEKK